MSVRQVRDALVLMGSFIALIWILQVFNWADGYRLDMQFGILPHDVGRLPEIFTAPFLHFSWQHIEGNTVPLFVLGVLAAYRGIGKFLLVTLIIAVVSGLAVWLFQSGSELTVGASGLIFGYFGYVLIRGFFDRNLVDIGVGVVAGLLYWTILQVAIPGTPGISWIGHLGGLFGGVLAAWVLRTRTPARVTAGWTTGLGGLRLGGGRGPATGPAGMAGIGVRRVLQAPGRSGRGEVRARRALARRGRAHRAAATPRTCCASSTTWGSSREGTREAMIRHTVLFKWKPEATDDEKEQVATELAKLPSVIPSLRAFACGRDAGLAQGNFDFAVSADFDDEAGFYAYRDDPAHREIVARCILPITAQRTAVQFRF